MRPSFTPLNLPGAGAHASRRAGVYPGSTRPVRRLGAGPPRILAACLAFALVSGAFACRSESARGRGDVSDGAARADSTVDAGRDEVGENRSSRHGEYVMYKTAAGDSVRAFVVYPERAEAAPGLIVIHEIFGLSEWIRSVADRYAAEGFISIAPDLLWGRGPSGGGTDAYPDGDAVIAAIGELPPDVVEARLDGAREYLRSLSSASGRVGVVGFCWGGHQSFQYAAEAAELGAAVVFYGSGPEPLSKVEAIRAPVLGLYGGDDNRINASIPEVERAMAAGGKQYEKEIYAGAGHGFLRDDQGPNAEAAAKAWTRSVAFLDEHLTAGGR